MQKQQISESQTKATKVKQGKMFRRLASFALGIAELPPYKYTYKD